MKVFPRTWGRMTGVAVMLAVCGCAQLAGLSGGLGSGGGASGLKLIANLSSTDLHAQVAYEQQADRTVFDVIVTGGPAGATIDVSIGGVGVGTLTLDDTGSGQLRLSSAPSGAGEDDLPSDFPTPSAGDQVHVGDLSGEFEEDHSDDDNGDDDANTMELKAVLSSGAVTAEVNFEDGDEREFSVEVSGGEAGAVYEVKVADVVVGSLTLDATGHAGLEFSSESESDSTEATPFPADFPAVAVGTTVSVGSLSGVFATDADSSADDNADDGADDSSDDSNDASGTDNSSTTP